MSEKLGVEALCAGYGRSQVLFSVSFAISEGSVLALLGPNGAGKTTLVKTLMGFIEPTSGSVRLDGRDITGRPPEQLARAGVGYVPQEHVVFPTLTVEENLVVGLVLRRAAGIGLDDAYTLFPKLGERRRQSAGTLSGGERKMLSLARALLGRPTLLILDEPTEGVWHGVVEEIGERLRAFARDGGTILLVEQNLDFARELANDVIVLERGESRPQPGPTSRPTSASASRRAV